MSEELKPCPFCGGSASIDRMGNSRVSMQISCDNCGCHFESGEIWIDEYSHWNKRATDRLEQENAELREGLQDLLDCKGILTSDKECVIKAKQLLNK